jgi:hypothetical protein
MSNKNDIEIKYRFTITEKGNEGLVFGMPTFITDGLPDIEGVDFEDIFKSILTDKSLETILNNRPDTIEGAQQIIIAQNESELKDRQQKVEIMNKGQNQALINEIEKKFTERVKDSGSNNDFPGISSDDELPEIFDDTFKSRLESLITHYNMLVNVIKNGKLFKMGKYEDIEDVKYPEFSINTFDNKDQKKSLVVFLFYVAKVFMRIPIVLLTASTTKQDLENYAKQTYDNQNITNIDTSNNEYIKSVANYDMLKKHIYPSEINGPNSGEDGQNKLGQSNRKLVQALTRGNANIAYNALLNSKTPISIDMLCFLLIQLLSTMKSTENYYYFIIAFCERMIYIIKYWCSKDDQKETSKLINLHFNKIPVNNIIVDNGDGTIKTEPKSRYFASILQKIHNTNDNLITFIKIRKGGVMADPTNSNKTLSNSDKMNIRYSGIPDKNDKKKQTDTLTLDNRILELRYDNTTKPFYKDCYAIGKTIIYKKKGEKCLTPSGDTYKPKIPDASLNISDPSYNHDFNFGPFTHIYGADKSNKNIAESYIFKEKIVKKLMADHPVSIIGYGASGSGKTSVLIQLSAPGKEPEKGVLMYISDEVGKKGFINCGQLRSGLCLDTIR